MDSESDSLKKNDYLMILINDDTVNPDFRRKEYLFDNVQQKGVWIRDSIRINSYNRSILNVIEILSLLKYRRI